MNFLIASIVYSYTAYVILGSLNKRLLETPILMSLCSIVLCGIIAFIIAGILGWSKLQNILIHYFHNNTYDSIWLDVIDYNDGSTMKVFFKNKDYYIVGAYHRHEADSDDPWFALSNYGQYDIKTNTIDPVVNFIEDDKAFITFRLSDVDHVEVF